MLKGVGEPGGADPLLSSWVGGVSTGVETEAESSGGDWVGECC
jgi:hypothetical protein